MDKLKVRYFLYKKTSENWINGVNQAYIPFVGMFVSFKEFSTMENLCKEALYRVEAVEGEHLYDTPNANFIDVINVILSPAGMIEKQMFEREK